MKCSEVTHPHVYPRQSAEGRVSGYVFTSVAVTASTREIATTLGISAKTVDRHRTNTLAKLGLHDRLALTRYAIRAGLIEP